MEKIILCTDGATYAETNYRYGAWFAQQMNASIEVLYVSEKTKPSKNVKNLSGSLGFNASDDLLKRIVEFEHDYAKVEQQKSAEILRHAQDFFESEGLLANTYAHHEGDLLADLQTQDSQADLILLGKCGSTGLDLKPHLGSHVERVMRSLKTPCLVTPQTFRVIDKVMLAYDDSPPCQLAFQQLLQYSFVKKWPLHLLQVVKQADQSVETRLQELQTQAQSHGIDVTVTAIEGETEEMLHSYIREQQISLLVMGIHGNRPLRNLVMGHTASHMIAEIDIPVLLFR